MTTNATMPPDDRPSGPPVWSRDAFERIQHVHNPGGAARFKIKGYWVHTRTFRDAFLLFWRNARSLDKSKTHTAESLACTPDWKTRPPGERRGMGRGFKLLALQGVLPIVIANPQAPYNFKYRLNDDLEQAPIVP